MNFLSARTRRLIRDLERDDLGHVSETRKNLRESLAWDVAMFKGSRKRFLAELEASKYYDLWIHDADDQHWSHHTERLIWCDEPTRVRWKMDPLWTGVLLEDTPMLWVKICLHSENPIAWVQHSRSFSGRALAWACLYVFFSADLDMPYKTRMFTVTYAVARDIGATRLRVCMYFLEGLFGTLLNWRRAILALPEPSRNLLDASVAVIVKSMPKLVMPMTHDVFDRLALSAVAWSSVLPVTLSAVFGTMRVSPSAVMSMGLPRDVLDRIDRTAKVASVLLFPTSAATALP